MGADWSVGAPSSTAGDFAPDFQDRSPSALSLCWCLA